MTVRILHCHSTFALGGKEARAVRLMNSFGSKAHHTILSATDDFGAREAIDPQIAVDFSTDAPSLSGKPSPARYRRLARYMRGFDLVLTYNWGAMDAVGARRIFGRGCPPLIHHEDGFNSDEAVRLNWKRNFFRQLMLDAAYALVVPSRSLAQIALEYWHWPDATRIPNGIDVAAYARRPNATAIPGFKRQKGEVVIGTLAGLRSVKNIPRLVRAFATLPNNTRLVIVGEGPERTAIACEALECGVADRVHMPGFLPRPQDYIGLFDIFALSSDSEQFPISVAEAMAAALPVVATDVGDIRAMLPTINAAFIANVHDEHALATRLGTLVDDAQMRTELGQANQHHAAKTLDEQAMIAAYVQLYTDALNSVRSAKSLL